MNMQPLCLKHCIVFLFCLGLVSDWGSVLKLANYDTYIYSWFIPKTYHYSTNSSDN